MKEDFLEAEFKRECRNQNDQDTLQFSKFSECALLSLLLIHYVMMKVSPYLRHYSKTQIISYRVYTNYSPFSPTTYVYSEFIALILDHMK